MSPDAQQLVGTLKQYQRRAFLVLTLSSVATGVLYALLGLLTYTLLLPISAALAQYCAMMLWIIMLTGLAIVNIRRFPTLRAITVQVDRTYQLQQRLETAMACLQQQDAFARLLHRDANCHLQALTPACSLPYRCTVPLKTSAYIACLVLTLTLGVRLLVQSERDHTLRGWPWQSGQSSSPPAVASQPLSLGHPMPSALTPDNTIAHPSTVQRSAERHFAKMPGTPVAAPSAAVGSQVMHRRSVSRASSGWDHVPTARSARSNSSPSLAETALPPTRQTRDAPIRSKPARQNVADRLSSRPARDSRVDAHPASIAKRAPMTAGSFAALARQPAQSAASSIPGAVASQEDNSAERPADHVAYRRTYQHHWQAAEAVLHGEEIPPALRHYIRAYFTSIQP